MADSRKASSKAADSQKASRAKRGVRKTQADANAKFTCDECGRTFESQEQFQQHQAECGKSIPGDAQVESDVSKIGYANRTGDSGTPEREWQGNRGQRDERPA